MIASVTVKLFTVLGRPALADSDASGQLRSFQAWSHSPLTAILLAIAFAGLVVLVIAPPGRRFSGRQAGAIGQGVVIFLGILGVVAWVSHNLWVELLVMAGLWGYLAWVIAASGLIAEVMTLPDRLASELSPTKRRELRDDRTAAVDRGSALTHVLDKIEDERR